MKGKKAVKAVKGSEHAQGFSKGLKDGTSAVAKGAQYGVVPGLVAGTVAGRLSSDKKIEKKASSDLAKKIATKVKDRAAKEGKRFAKGTDGDPMKMSNKAVGAAIGGISAYKGQKLIQEENRAKKKASK